MNLNVSTKLFVAVLFNLLVSSSHEEHKIDALQEMDSFERAHKNVSPGEMER